jgi:transcriptional regulator with XRE-family HTH domain
MFPPAVILEIRRLLDEGDLSHRAIAEQMGVSRGVVNNIARGRRGPRVHKNSSTCPSALHVLNTPARCRKCGGLVYQPCLLCRTRAYQRLVNRPRRPPPLAA